MKYTVEITGWHPAKVNQWDGRHWAVRSKLKKADRDTVFWAVRAFGVPAASGKRRVGLTIVLGPRQRAGDPDCYWKSLLDGLVAAGVLVDDNRQGVELEPVRFCRGKCKATIITIEDVAPEIGVA